MINNSQTLTRIDRISVKDQALEQLKRYIQLSNVKVGQRLPSERELAERLGIGRSSVREALKILEAVGLVETRVGDGTYVTAQAGASFGRTIGFSLAAWGGTLIEIMDARQMIEVAAARVAAQRSTDDDLAALRAEVERMEATIDSDPQAYLAADMNFHRLIGRATHNQLVAQIITYLIDMLERLLKEADQLSSKVTDEGKATHRAVLDAIISRDPEAAAKAMLRHQKYAAELWRAVLSLGNL